jgi:hypothetical protein
MGDNDVHVDDIMTTSGKFFGAANDAGSGGRQNKGTRPAEEGWTLDQNTDSKESQGN